MKINTQAVSKSFTYLILLTLCIYPKMANAQEVKIKLGPDHIGANQAFTIVVTISGGKLENYSNFPDIEGFKNKGTSSTSTMKMVDGQISSSQSITMTYTPERQGVFSLSAFSIKVNGEVVSSPGKTIEVGPPRSEDQKYRDKANTFFSTFNKDSEK